jgi:glycerol uptake facilitator-like aquaporin
MSDCDADNAIRQLGGPPETGTGQLRLNLTRRLVAETPGTAFLLIAVVGSGIVASRLSPSDTGLQLLENAVATAAALIGLILMFGSVSGIHFNPIVTLVDRLLGTIRTRDALLHIIAQVAGGCLGTICANVMFSLPAVVLLTKIRSLGALWFSEVLATIGLLLVNHGCVRTGRATAVPFAGGICIGGAYFFTSSTSFANPVASIGRFLSNSFAGIRPSLVPMFVVMQVVGTLVAYALIRFIFPRNPSEAQ